MSSADHTLKQTDHRPWALPRRSWLWSQQWRSLLFAHWSLSEEAVRPHVPTRLEIDTKDNAAWVSVVGFRMSHVRPRRLPSLPPVSNFLELNLRTYVRLDGRPGVFFLSIHASKRLAVRVAKWFSPLPYAYARMDCSQKKGEYRFQCDSAEQAGAIFAAHYQPASEVYTASGDSLTEWLLERYCLYAGNSSGALVSTEVHHAPWAVQDVILEISSNTLGRPFGLNLSPTPDQVHFSPGVNALAWSFERVANQSREENCRH